MDDEAADDAEPRGHHDEDDDGGRWDHVAHVVGHSEADVGGGWRRLGWFGGIVTVFARVEYTSRQPFQQKVDGIRV